MAKLAVTVETGPLSFKEFKDRMNRKKDYLFPKYLDLYAQASSAEEFVERSFIRTIFLCLFALGVFLLYPEVGTRLLALALALCVFVPLGFDISSALSASRDFKRLVGDAVIMKDEFLHQIQLFRDSNAGQMDELENRTLELLEWLPDFAGVTRDRPIQIWGSVVFTVLMFVAGLGLLFFSEIALSQ